MPTDNRRTDHIGDSTEMVRTAREVAEEVAIDSGKRLMAYATLRYHKCLVQPFRNQLADAIERGINKYLEEHR